MNVEAVRSALAGTLIPAVPVPFTTESAIDVEQHHRYIRWMNGQSVGAVAVWSHTGRGLLLNPDQRAEVLEAWRDGASHTIVAGVGVPADRRLPIDPRTRTDAVIDAVMQMVADAREGGATAVLVHPPTALRELADPAGRISAVHEAVGESGLPFIIFYLYEAAGGIAYSPALLDTLVSLPGAVGVKLATLDSVMTVQNISAQMADRADVLLITGEDRFLGYSLTLGAQAALIGMGAALTDVMVDLMQRHAANDSEGMMPLAAAVDRFAAATFTDPMEGYVQRMLWALADDGVVEGDPVDPFGPVLGADDRDTVRAAVQALQAER